MTYLKYLLALLFSLLQLNLFSQTYYIYVKYDVQAEYTPEITLFWSDKSETTCANTNDLHKITGLYEKHIVKLQIGNVLEIDLTKNTNMTKEQSYSYEVNDFAIKLQYDTKWSFDLFQTPITPKIDAAYKENNYYCVDDTLEFEVTNLSDTMYTSPLEIQLTQNNDIIYSGQSNTPRFKIAYGKLHVTNYPLKNVKIEIKITGKSGKPIVANSDNVTQIWKYVEVGDSDLYVIDNSLHYPKLTDDKTIVLTNIINAHYDTISDTIYNLSRNYGVYQMEIDQAEHCQITKTFVYPQITYNYINDSVNFWYSDDKRNAVDLKCYSFENTPNFAINYSDYTISKNETDSILVQDTNGQCEKKVPCHSITYHLNCTESLKAINISGNKDFIPVTQNILLKSYPKINVDTLKITPPTCYKDSVKITLDKISGGMGKDYSCVLSRSDNNNAKKIVALNNDTLIVPRSYFENTISPVIITVYDKDTILDDCGFEKRAFTKNPITLDFPDTIKITEIINKNLYCHHDFSGRIEIKSYEPKNQDYTFLIFNDTVSIYNFKADSLAAGKYKLKLSDKNNCESDTYLDSISEPLELKITD
ncbi:hypothetical protein II906_05375, partial [bacterium]|nr:hypothetical protein [bacterium]